MGSAVSITATIRALSNNYSYMLCNRTISIDCSKATYKGHWYLEPFVSPTLGISYVKFATAQTAFAVEVVEVSFEGHTYFLSGTEADYTTKCNACCGATPVLTPIDVPVYVAAADQCPVVTVTTTATYTFKFHLANVASGQTFTLSLFVNGVAGSPATSSALASPAAALTYANANWSAYGTWTIDDTNTLVLTTTVATPITLVRAMVNHDFCVAPTFPLTFDNITRDGDNGTTVTYTLPAAVTVSDNVALKAALSSPTNFFADGVLTTAVAGKLNYNGPGRPFLIKSGVTTVGTWTAGVCA